MFLEISQNSQENIFARVSFLIKLKASADNFIKKRLWHRCFPVNFTKFLRTLFLTEHLRWLLLVKCCIVSDIQLQKQQRVFPKEIFYETIFNQASKLLETTRTKRFLYVWWFADWTLDMLDIIKNEFLHMYLKLELV